MTTLERMGVTALLALAALPVTAENPAADAFLDKLAPDVERGRSTYRLSADTLDVVDEAYTKDGVLTVFGRTRLERVK
jgi:hypothetical protein